MGLSFTDVIRERLEQNKNALIAIIGETGSGKSYSALRLAELIDDDFNVAEKVCFRPVEFVKAVRNARKGAAIIFDEAGVGIPAREWWSIQNRLLDYVIQTFRFKNLCVIFTMPNLNFIDEHARLLFHYVLETQFIDYEAEQTVLKPFKIMPYSRTKKTYMVYPRLKNVVIRRLIVSKPSERIISDYEAKKEAYLNELYNEITETLEPKTEKEVRNIDEEIIAYFEENADLLKRFKKKTDLTVFIRQKFKVGIRRAESLAGYLLSQNSI